jgi:hypothetical protein
MIDTDLARRLKRAGLDWRPAERDFFAIPDHNLDGQVFVVGQLPALVQTFSGEPTITFHGSIEWALDYILLAEALWLPTETQLREALARAIGDDAPLRLDRTPSGYRCQIAHAEHMLAFDAPSAEDAYAQALLAVLEMRQGER